MIKLTTKQRWIKTIAWLRRNFPASSPIYVASISLGNLHGSTSLRDGSYRIAINQKKSFALRLDTLLHEWAHALTWLGAETHIEDHGGEWGLAYAKIYRTFWEWNYGREHMGEEE